MEIVLAIASFAFAAAVTAGVRGVAQSARLLAVATQRSSHKGITPVGGGLSIVFVFALGTVAMFVFAFITTTQLGVLLSALPVAMAGLADDKKPLDFRVRLAIQAACALFALIWVGALPAIPFGPFSLPLGLLGFVLVPVAFIWLTNLYNFMDGIDGIAGAQGAFVCAGAAVIFLQHGDSTLALLCLLLFSAYIGFLVFNWQPASIFMGDVGSGFSGFMLGALALLGHSAGTMSLWSWVLLLGIFIVDATATLLTRWHLRQRWYEAHRSHVYQKLALRYGSHSAVVWRILLLNVLWLLPLALLAGKLPEYGVYFAITGLLPLSVAAFMMGAGRPAP